MGTTPLLIDVHLNGYTNATNRAVSPALMPNRDKDVVVTVIVETPGEDLMTKENSKKFSIWEKVYNQTKGASFALSLEVPCHKHFLA